jgi:hypothetical protein
MKAQARAGQKTVRPDVPASAFRTPARPFAVPSPAAGPSLGPEARIDNARRFGHNLSRLQVPAASQAPIQRTKTKKKKETATSRTPLLRTPPVERSQRSRPLLIDARPEIEPRHHEAIATPIPEDTSLGLSIASGLGSTARTAARVGDALNAQVPSAVSPIAGVVGNPLAAVGSTIDAGVKMHQMATSSHKLEDKALTGVGAVSDLANATVSGTSAAMQGAELMGGTLSSALQVAGPAAMVMGAADLVGGGISGGLAAHRQKKLEEIQQEHEGTGDGAIAKFAKESQRTRKTRGFGTALKGGLALGGGIALALGAGPIGWGLLGGAALVGGGMALYKQYRKHKQGKEILDPKNPQYREQLERADIRIPTQDDLDKQSWLKRWNPLNTRESRTHDLIRAQIAHKLEESVNDPNHNEVQNDDGEDSPLTAVVGHLGIKNRGRKARAKDIASALAG